MAAGNPKSSEDMITEARQAFDANPASVENPPLPPAIEAEDPGTKAEPVEMALLPPAPRPTDEIKAPPAELRPHPVNPDREDLEEPEPGFVTRLWARRGVAVALIVGGVFVYSTFFDDSKPVESLGPGECIDDPGVTEIIDISTIECTEPHDFEVFATVTLPATGSYPPDSTLLPMAWEECYTHFEDYVGVPFGASVLYIHALVPTGDGWEEGDRGATCLLFEVDAAENLVKSTGSARQAQA